MDRKDTQLSDLEEKQKADQQTGLQPKITLEQIEEVFNCFKSESAFDKREKNVKGSFTTQKPAAGKEGASTLSLFAEHIDELKARYYENTHDKPEFESIEKRAKEALHALEKHYLSQVKAGKVKGNKKDFPLEKQQELSLAEINKASEAILKPHPFFFYASAPYLVNFLYLAMKIFSGLNLKEKGTGTGEQGLHEFLYEVYEYIWRAQRSLHLVRKSDIQFEVQGEFSEYIYIVDKGTNTVLTEVLPFNQTTAAELEVLLSILKEKISSEHMEKASLDDLHLFLNKLSGSKHKDYCSWKFLKKFYCPDTEAPLPGEERSLSEIAQETKTNPVYGMILPPIRKKYFGSSLEDKLLRSSSLTADTSSNRLDKSSCKSEAAKGYEKKSIGDVFDSPMGLLIARQALLFTIALAASGPVALLAATASFIVGLLFKDEDKTLDIETVVKEIQERIEVALNLEEARHLTAKMQAVVLNYDLRMNILKNMPANQGKDKKDWDLGDVKDWEALLMSFNDLTVYFETDRKVRYLLGYVYQTYSVLYLLTLGYVIVAAKEKEKQEYYIKLLEQYCRKSYIFVCRLYDEAWDYTLSYLDFRRIELTLYKVGAEGREVVQTVPDVPSSLEPFMAMLETTYRQFSTRNSAAIDLAKAVDAIAQNCNKVYNSDLPVGVEHYIKFGSEPDYEKVVRRMQKHENFPLDQEDYWPVNTNRDFKILTRSLWQNGPDPADGQVVMEHLTDNGGVDKVYDYGPGDYILLPEIKQIKSSSLRIRMLIPCIVCFYETADFTGKGMMFLPREYQWRQKEKQMTLINFRLAPFKSMKVRHSYRSWYPIMQYYNFARLEDTDFNEPTKLVNFNDFKYYKDPFKG